MSGLFQRSAQQAWPTLSVWQAETAGLVAHAVDRWRLRAGEPYTGGEAGAVLAVTTDEDRPAVLKVGFPHVEAVGEALALEAWAPELAPRVLRQEPWAWWLLLERIEPGTPLSRAGLPPEEALSIGARLLRDLGRVAPPEELPSVSEIVTGYLADATQRSRARATTLASRDDERLVDDALALAAALAEGDAGRALVHGDLNPGNLLRADDRSGGWVAIDPKPMRGAAEFDLEPLVTQLASAQRHAVGPAQLEGWMTEAADQAGLDARLAIRWAVARTALDVTWYAADGHRAALTSALARLRAWTAVAGR